MRDRSERREAQGKPRAWLGQVFYCVGIALALTAIAFVAEGYRNYHGSKAEAPVAAAVEPDATRTAQPEPELRLPEGELLRGWTQAPAWNAELGLWESHRAADYRLPDGEVRCLCPGTVRAVGVSAALGGYVEVACGELIVRYASIAPRDGLKAGDELAEGELIGRTDASLPGESALGHHLHLQIERNGEAVDFTSAPVGD